MGKDIIKNIGDKRRNGVLSLWCGVMRAELNQLKLEAVICEAFIKFQRDLIGRGPEETRVYVFKDMVIIRSKGVLTREEKHVATTRKGRSLVKQLRQELRETYIDKAEDMVARITGCKVLGSYGDVSIRTGDYIEVYVLDCDLQKKLGNCRSKNF